MIWGKLINKNNIGESLLWWENMKEEDENSEEFEGAKGRTRKGRLGRKKNSSESEDTVDEPKGRLSRRRRKSEKRRSFEDYESEEKEISQGRLWLSQNWKPLLALFMIFLFGIFLRSYFYYPAATGDGFILSGNDPYYHKRVVDYVQDNHQHLEFDPLLSYPDGAINPRPPLFDWSVAIIGLILAPLFGGNVTTSTWQVMEFSPAFWGALTVVPVYFIGKEMFNKKVGLMCAFLLSTMPSHVERSPLGFSDHDAIVLFFVALAFFFFIKALNTLEIRDKWVENWLNPKDIPKGLKEWFKYNQVPVAFSLFSGLSLATIALIWKGFLYPVVIIIVYFFIQLILNKLRNKDSLGVALCTIITLMVIAILPIPYYYGNNMNYVIEPAAEILLAVIIVSVILVPTRDSPWILVFSTLAVILVCGFILLMYVFPEIGNTYFSGQGYFSENKVFSTIAEAQAPDYSRAMFSYGIVTTFLAMFALIIALIRVAKDLKAHYLFMTIWGMTAIYMAISATRFIFNAGPIFAILSGWMVYEIIIRLDFRKMMKHYRSLKGGGRFYALKKSVKVSHIVGVLFLVFMIFLPNLWLGWDAGVPFGEKKSVDVAVYDVLPWFMKPEEYNNDQAGNITRYPDGTNIMYNRTNQNELKYFGAFGHGFPSDYWLDGMRWLSEQDTDLPIEERPAFISWWDYGFWAIYLGQHPTAADNFQGRVQYAGSFISSENESQSMSLLIARILEADMADYFEVHGENRLNENVRDILVKYLGDEKAADVEDVIMHPENYKDEVLDNPGRYGHYSKDLVPNVTPIYAVLQTWIPELTTDDERVWLLHDLQDETGYSLRYFAIDSRLFPFAPLNTGIFYAPLKLSDHRISESNEPYDYLQTILIASDGREYTSEEFKVARESKPDLEVTDYKLRYYEPFLESMLLKCYIGYTLADIGAADPAQQNVEPNIPGVHATNYFPMPAWMMKHYQLVYRTSYWNPYNQSEYTNHPNDWEAMSEKEASALIEEMENDGIDNDKNGQVDDQGEGGVVTSGLKSGVVFIKYIEGAYLNGTVTTYQGTPVKNIRVTVADDYGIPHDSTHTDENGTYQLIAPAGNVSLQLSSGGYLEGEYAAFSVLSQIENIRLNVTNINISDDQVMRRNIDLDNDGILDYNIVQDFAIEPNILEGRVFLDNDSNEEYDENIDHDIPLANVRVHNEDLDMDYSVISEENGSYIFDDLSPGDYTITVERHSHNITIEDTISLQSGQTQTQNIGIKPGHLFGNLSSEAGNVLVGDEVKLLDLSNDTTIIRYTDSEGQYNYNGLLPGDYTIIVEKEGFERYIEDFYFAEGNVTEKNIVLSPSTDVEGIVTYLGSGETIKNASIRFDGMGENEDRTRFVRTNEVGYYSTDLKNGKYWVRIKHYLEDDSPYVYFGTMEVLGGTITHDIILQKGVEVYGTLFRDFNENGTIEDFETRGETQISFESAIGKIIVTTNSTGYYQVFLPPGNYSLYAAYDGPFDTGFGKLSIPAIDMFEFNFELENGEKLQGDVYHDINKNSVREAREGLPYSILTFTDEDGISIKFTTDFLGHFYESLPSNGTYSVLAEYPGFEVFSLPSMNITNIANQSEFIMTPLEISIFGITHYEGTVLNNISISFIATAGGTGEDNSTSSDSSGDYTIGLMPGEYQIFVDYNTTDNGKPVRYLFNDTIYLEVGEGTREFDINMTKNIKINGTVNGISDNVSIHFVTKNLVTFDALSANGSFELFLVPDEYTVSVYHMINSTTYYVYLDTLNFNESQSIVINVSLGVMVEGVAEYEAAGAGNLLIAFSNNGSLYTGTNSTGGFNIFLPPNRTYDVTIDQTLTEGGEEVIYIGSGMIEIDTSEINGYNINLTKYIKVNGVVYIDWDSDNEIDTSEKMDNISLTFNSIMDTITVSTNKSGNYEVFLILDNLYNISLTSDFSIVDENFNITPSMTDNEKDFSIALANLTVSGTTLRSGTPESFTALWFWGQSPTAINNTVISDLNGDFSVELSHGDYSLYARKVEGPDVFVYLTEISVLPRENLVLNINLVTGNKVSGAAYYINTTNENLSAQLQIDFTDVGKISSNTDENGQFELWLPTGNYQVNADLTTFEYNMSMNYTYKEEVEVNDDTEIFLDLDKIKIYEVDIEWVEGTPETIGQNQSVTNNVRIVNKGNVKEIFDIIRNGVPDWNITFDDNITLDIGESKIVEIYITASPTATVDHGPFTIDAVSRTKPDSTDNVEIEINITQIYEKANMTLGIFPVARNNTINYTVDIRSEGNGLENFKLSISGIPGDWNASLDKNELQLRADEMQSIVLSLIIPYNTTERTGMILLTAVSEGNLTSTFEIEVDLPNLEIGHDDLTISGDDVSEGPLNKEPIPGFEVILLLISLLLVAILLRRREIK